MNPPPNLRNPPLICETVQGPEKRPSQGPKNDRNDPEKIPSPRHTYSKHILQKNWSKMIICGLSSGQTNLHPPIWGHGRQLDDRHRHPNINIREIIWLGNQLSRNSAITNLWRFRIVIEQVFEIPPFPGRLTQTSLCSGQTRVSCVYFFLIRCLYVYHPYNFPYRSICDSK